MKSAWIQAEKATYPLTKLCRWLDVTRSGLYAWRARPESTHAREDRRLTVLVRASFEASKQRYGSPCVHEDLLEQEEHVSRKRVVRLMQKDGLKVRRRKRYKLTTMSDHDQPVAANLLDRHFDPHLGMCHRACRAPCAGCSLPATTFAGSPTHCRCWRETCS